MGVQLLVRSGRRWIPSIVLSRLRFYSGECMRNSSSHSIGAFSRLRFDRTYVSSSSGSDDEKDQLKATRSIADRSNFDKMKQEAAEFEQQLGESMSFQSHNAFAMNSFSTSLDGKSVGVIKDEWNDLVSDYVPEPVPKSVTAFFSDLGQKSLLFRKQDFVMENILEASELAYLAKQNGSGSSSSISPDVVLFDGPRGTGKTASLIQAVVNARASGWLVFYVSNGRHLMDGDGTYVAHSDEDGRVLWYDRPEYIANILDVFEKYHGKMLETIPLKRTAKIHEVNEAKTLLDLVKTVPVLMKKIDRNWENTPRLVGDVMSEVMEELKLVEEYPVMVAIDHINNLSGVSMFMAPRKRRIHCRAIRVAQPFVEFEALGKSIKNGLVVAATCYGHVKNMEWRKSRIIGGLLEPFKVTELDTLSPYGEHAARNFHATSQNIKIDMIRDPGALVDGITVENPNVSIHCSPFSKQELETLLAEYYASKFMGQISMETVDRLWALSGGRGHLIHQIVATM